MYKIKFRICLKEVSALFFLWMFLSISFYSNAQTKTGILRGNITDGSSSRPLYGVSVSTDSLTYDSASYFNGQYSISLNKGSNKVFFRIPGYEGKLITGIEIKSNETHYLDIELFPDGQRQATENDSVSVTDASFQGKLISNTYAREKKNSLYNPHNRSFFIHDKIDAPAIQPGTDRNTLQLLRRLNGVSVFNNYRRGNIQSINIAGFGDRYNQLLINGTNFNSFDPVSRAFPLSLLPSEAIEHVSVQTASNGSLPADFAGGTINIQTKDIPDRNFFYVQAGAGFSDETGGKTFLGDKRSDLEFLALPGSHRDLPEEFPTTRSLSNLGQKNIQEQVYFSKLLKNNLEPIDQGSAGPDERVLIGFGKVIKKKSGVKVGIVGYLNQQRTERIDETTVQVFPDITANPFPFNGATKLIRSQSDDINYRYSSQLSGVLNAAVVSGYNKFSFKNFLGAIFDNNYTLRSNVSKPDEDT
ncbi:MAG: TonB-dependent receptor plug domain-containing protein, partial [Chitinophagaceae bacterium]|nr:TonB-dependent receptor plug domain-containing protein [Chitinophagaceae bacterium]